MYCFLNHLFSNWTLVCICAQTVHRFQWIRHVDIWGISFQMIEMAKMYAADWNVFLEGQTCYITYIWSLYIWSEITFVYVLLSKSLHQGSWYKYTKMQSHQTKAAWNNVFVKLFCYVRFSSASEMFLDEMADNFAARIKRFICEFHGRPNASGISLAFA